MNGLKFFGSYYSNTLGGSGNQYFFESDGQVRTGRIFYKALLGGKRKYSLMLGNIIDSTYSDGSRSFKNLACGDWRIISLRAGACKSDIFAHGVTENANQVNKGISDFVDVCFDGQTKRSVLSGETFFSDEFILDVEQGGYICIEMTYCGGMLPYHEESILPIYAKSESGWVYEKMMPIPCCVACKREAKARVGFVGDSITQGIGTQINSYAHWNARLAEMLGSDYAYWNLGLGYGRAEDLASDGIWMEKTLTNDIVFVCFGVNDLLQGKSVENIKRDLMHIADRLVSAGIKVIFQTLPPFDYQGERISQWQELNAFILDDIAKKVDFVFDNSAILGMPNALHTARFGGHPNEEGCAVWAEALYSALTEGKVFEASIEMHLQKLLSL